MTTDVVRSSTPSLFDRTRAAAPAVRPHGFFLAAIVLTLTAGATWGAILLVRIAWARSFTSLSVFEVNAHGQAQIYGWVGLFILGAAYLLVPRFTGVSLAHPGFAVASLPLMVTGTVVRAFGEPFPEAGLGPVFALTGAGLQLLAVAVFLLVMVRTLRQAPARGATHRYLLAALGWFAVAAVLDVVHLARLLGAPTRDALLRQVAVWQFALREAQIHGLALTLIFGMSLWLLPALLRRKVAMQTLAKRLWWPLQIALVVEIVAFVTFMTTYEEVWAGVMWAGQVVFAGAALAFAIGLGLWQRGPVTRELKFLRASHVWLAVALFMLVSAPAWSALVHEPFSHAWYGATRHAVTVGFVSLTIVGIGAALVRQVTGRALSRKALLVAFVLLNVGCTLRVALQAWTDLAPAAFPVAGVSGLFEVAGLTVWGVAMGRALLGREPTRTQDAEDDLPRRSWA